MYRFFGTLLIVIFLPVLLLSQVMPAEGSVLNYRIAGFSFPAKKNGTDYTLQIAKGSFHSEESFKANIIKNVHSVTNRVIAEVPSFGAQYTWRVVYTSDKSAISAGPLFHFHTGSCPGVDTANARLRITHPASQFQDGYVLLESNTVLYDMTGAPVWYLPAIEGRMILPRDLKVTPQGTITFIASNDAWEINYNGEVLWKAPDNGVISGEQIENYHHEFTRLPNGHYMVLGSRPELWKTGLRNAKEKKSLLQAVNTPGNTDTSLKRSFFGTLIEYDENGKIVWSWKSFDYFANSDLCYYLPAKGTEFTDTHENSFFFDEKNSAIYIGCRNISRIIKIKYPEGTVLCTYGETYKPGITAKRNGLFCGQHGVRVAQDGSLFLFNNNECNAGAAPTVGKFKEPLTANTPLEKIWEYECATLTSAPDGFPSGGNIVALPESAVFVSAAGPDSRVFILNTDKEILWDAIPERWNDAEKKWGPTPQFHASIIEKRAGLENLIWNTSIPLNSPRPGTGNLVIPASALH